MSAEIIDHMGTNNVSLRKMPDGGVSIRLLSRAAPAVDLTATEWFDLVALVMAAKSYVDFRSEYTPA